MNKIEKIKMEICNLLAELDEEKNKTKSYFIGVELIGDWDYWDEYYHPLGFITEATAESWDMLTNSDEDEDLYVADGIKSDRILAVDEDTYDLYVEWWNISQDIKKLEMVSRLIDTSAKIQELKLQEADIIKKLDIKYPEFQHPGDRICCRDENDEFIKNVERQI